MCNQSGDDVGHLWEGFVNVDREDCSVWILDGWEFALNEENITMIEIFRRFATSLFF
jgi:hypothetical protein